MNLRILKWSYKNIRGVNNLSISVEKELNIPYKINLIMMPNGFGKTTTQTLFRAIFDGSAVDWDYDKVTGFKPPNSDDMFGEFKVTLLIDNNIFVVYLKLEYSDGKAFYQTSRVADQGGLENGHKLPSFLKSAFTPEFVKRFVFDGELAKDIIGSQSQQAERTIRYLYQLNRLGEMKQRVTAIVQEKQKNMEKTNTKTEQGLTKLRSEKNTITRVLKNLQIEKQQLENEKELKENRLNFVVKEISEHIKSDETLKEQVEMLEQEKISIENGISEKSQSILNDFRNPFLLSQAIANKLSLLSSKMQTLKLPRTMSKQFFEELAEHDNCICGRTIGSVEKAYIIGKADEFLGEDQIGVINTIKSSIKGRVYNEELIEEVNALNSLIVKRDKLKSDWDRIQNQRTDEGDIELQNLELERNDLEVRLENVTEKLRTLTTNDKFEKEQLTYQENIPLCNDKLTDIEEKIAEATNTVTLLNNSEKLKRILTEIDNVTINKLKDRIKDETNEKLTRIIQAEHIEVEEIKGYLKLADKSGASEGQSLAIAYSFLGSMFETSSHNLPFIVDSPAGSLDLSVRRQVSKTISHLFDQLIIFITSGERDGFTEYFYQIEDEVQFLTISKENQGTLCIEGKETFDSFQDEEEVVKN